MSEPTLLRAFVNLLLGLAFFLAGALLIGWRMDKTTDIMDALGWFGVFVLWCFIGGAISILIVIGDEQ